VRSRAARSAIAGLEKENIATSALFIRGATVRAATLESGRIAQEHQENPQAVTAKEVLLEMAAGYVCRRGAAHGSQHL
jgi:hypothetical protein